MVDWLEKDPRAAKARAAQREVAERDRALAEAVEARDAGPPRLTLERVEEEEEDDAPEPPRPAAPRTARPEPEPEPEPTSMFDDLDDLDDIEASLGLDEY